MLRHPAHFIALGAGAGLIPFAPGTFGTLLAFPIFWLIGPRLEPAVYLALVAALFGAIFALLLAPNFPMPAEIPVSSYVILPVVAIIVGLLASLAGLRRAVTVSPALAFGGA